MNVHQAAASQFASPSNFDFPTVCLVELSTIGEIDFERNRSPVQDGTVGQDTLDEPQKLLPKSVSKRAHLDSNGHCKRLFRVDSRNSTRLENGSVCGPVFYECRGTVSYTHKRNNRNKEN